jgi:hypothetical protein
MSWSIYRTYDSMLAEVAIVAQHGIFGLEMVALDVVDSRHFFECSLDETFEYFSGFIFSWIFRELFNRVFVFSNSKFFGADRRNEFLGMLRRLDVFTDVLLSC